MRVTRWVDQIGSPGGHTYKLGSSSINMVLNLLTTTQGAESTTTALCAKVYCDPWRPLGVKFTTTAPCAEVN